MHSCFEEIADRDAAGILKTSSPKQPQVLRKSCPQNRPSDSSSCKVISNNTQPIFNIPNSNFSEVNLNDTGTVNLGHNLGRSFSQSSFYNRNSYCCGSSS